MDIRVDQAKLAIMEYVDEVFSGLEFNVSNVGSMLLAKIMIENKFNSILPVLTNDKGMIPVDVLEKYGMEAMQKIGTIEIPKISGKLLFKQDDFIKLLSKMKSKAEM